MPHTITTLTKKLTGITRARIVQASKATKPATTVAGKKARTKAKADLRKLVSEAKAVNKQITALRKFEAKAAATATKSDKSRSAKAPGRRVSKTGHVYYESRTNRADSSGRSHI